MNYNKLQQWRHFTSRRIQNIACCQGEELLHVFIGGTLEYCVVIHLKHPTTNKEECKNGTQVKWILDSLRW